MTSAIHPQQQNYDSISDAKLLDAVLEAGEQVRLPLVVLMNWKSNSWMLAQTGGGWIPGLICRRSAESSSDKPRVSFRRPPALARRLDQAQEVSTVNTFADRGTTRDRAGHYTHWWMTWLYSIPRKGSYPRTGITGWGGRVPRPGAVPGGV